MGFISLRIKPSTSSGPVAKYESEQFNQYMKNEREKSANYGASCLDIHCICFSCSYYYTSYDGIGPCHDWFIFNKDVCFILVWTFQV